MTTISREQVESAARVAADRLRQEMKPGGYWEGELSSSALSTATAVSALCIAGTEADGERIRSGASWLAITQNADGGWGDTTDSPSNLSTTLLAMSALKLARAGSERTLEDADSYVTAQAGRTPAERVATVGRIYGADRTFAVPILVNCALAGLVPWDQIPGLPFELAVLPRGWYRALRLHVVSYALPALIAIGLAIHHHSRPGFSLRRLVRRLVTGPALARLARIQPENGGFLEATPLTSFVAMSLAPICGAEQPVVDRCLRFIRESQRPDGSWPIDTNLSVWLTTGAVSALARAGRMDEMDRQKTRRWLVERQHRAVHPFTGAAPGGWCWTHLPGGVPDADDTAGAVRACLMLGERDAALRGVRWLLDLQNADGGWPAFCKGWGQLPFDRSSPDVTAHALRALLAFDAENNDARSRRATRRGFGYLARTQRPDGAWAPLWFGSQSTADKSNSVLGTSRVLMAYAELDASSASKHRHPECVEGWDRIRLPAHPSTGSGWRARYRSADNKRCCWAEGVRYLEDAQNRDGGWGGDRGCPSSVEETALAVIALSRLDCSTDAVSRGIEYLVSRIEDGSWILPAPIGLYFSSLWYSEKLYPVIWTAEALGEASYVILSEAKNLAAATTDP